MDPTSTRPIALVTGASTGIGLALSQVLADNQHELVIVGDDRERIEAAAAGLRRSEHAPEVHALTLDLSEPRAIDRIADELGARGLEVDVLVCNASIAVTARSRETGNHTVHRDDLTMKQLRVCSAVVALTERIAAGMVERQRGNILFTASVNGESPLPLGVYGAMKAFVFSFAEAVRDELHGTGVQATALCPSAIAKRVVRATKTPAWSPLANAAIVAQAGYEALMRTGIAP